jgi:membrane associated rhomboid family serine protease
MLLFLIFAPFVERKLGSKIFILVYFICGSIGYIFCDLAYKENKIVIEEIIYKTGIDIHDIKIKDFSIDEKYIEKLSEKEYEKVILYNRVISKTVGSSGAITGIIFIYLFYMREIRKILTISFALFIIYITINNFIRPGLLLEIGDSAHFGGMIGAIIYLIIQFDWYNNCESHIKCLSLREPKRQ